MLIKNDESCNSEKTILRYQENGIADLLASDWYGSMLLSPGGRVYLDNYNDIHILSLVGHPYIMDNAVQELRELFPNHCRRVADVLKTL